MSQPRAILRNIQSVVALEEGTQKKRSFSDRLADSIATFTGTIVFVVLHLVWFAVWVTFNMGLLGGAAFDPYPFQLLCMLVSLEGVLLSAFVLIKQNRMSRNGDRRAHLDLQVNLLAEKEVTKVLQLLGQISERLGIEVDAEARELMQITAVGDVAGQLEQKLPEET